MANLMAKRKTLVDSMMRDAIYEGAVVVLAEHGLNGATMDRVAAAAGVAKGSLYKGFGDKRTLFLKALDHYLERGRATLRELADDPRSGAELLRHWLDNVAAMATCTGLRRGCMSVNCTVELAPHDNEIRNRLRKHEREIEKIYVQLIGRGARDGSLRSDLDVQASAEWLTTIIDGLQVRGKLGLTRAQAESAVAMAMRALAPT